AQLLDQDERVDSHPPEMRRIEIDAQSLAAGLAQAPEGLAVVDHEPADRLHADLDRVVPGDLARPAPVRDKPLLPLPPVRVLEVPVNRRDYPVRRTIIGPSGWNA